MLQIVLNLMKTKTKIKILYFIKLKNFRKFLNNFKKFILKFWAKMKIKIIIIKFFDTTNKLYKIFAYS